MPPRTRWSGPSAPHSAVPVRPARSTSIWSSATWLRASSTTASASGMCCPGLVALLLSPSKLEVCSQLHPSSSVRVLGQCGASTTVPRIILNRVCLPVRLLSQGLTSPLCPAPCCLPPRLPASPALFCFSSSLTWDPTPLFFSQPHKPGCSAFLPPAYSEPPTPLSNEL